jgi:succinate dehydrogenase flavin-adding protein (antitoxin of CptAB toxin-antitoxin module)
MNLVTKKLNENTDQYNQIMDELDNEINQIITKIKSAQQNSLST